MNACPRKTGIVRYCGAALLALGIFAALNFLASVAKLRLDFTQGRVYSLSPATKSLLGRLESPLAVTLYYSRELPPQILSMKSYLRDFLDEYARASHGRLRVDVREIGSDEQEMQQALKAGVLPVRFDIYSKDRYEQRDGFFGLVLQYRDRKQLFPFVNDTNGLEYELSSRVKALLSGAKPSIGFLNGHGALSPYAMEPAFTAKVGSSYNIELVDLNALLLSSETVRHMPALFILGPEEEFSASEIRVLDGYLSSGGAVVAALNSRKVSLRNYSTVPNPTGLEPWLEARGLRLRGELVLDSQNQAIQVSRQQGLFVFRNIVQYPPFVLASELDREHPVTRTLDSLVFPFVSPVEVVEGSRFKRLDTLAWSSKKSWYMPGKDVLPDMDPFQNFGAGSRDAVKGPFRLAVAAQACFKPYEAVVSTEAASSRDIPAPECGRLVLVGTSRFVQPDYSMPDMNYIFLLNLIDWAAQDQALIDIRAKAAAFHPLRELSPGAKKAVRYAIFLGPPLLAILAGLAVWRMKIRRRKVLAALYSSNAA